MEASDAKRLRELEAENTKLKRLLAEAHLDMDSLEEMLIYPAVACPSVSRSGEIPCNRR